MVKVEKETGEYIQGENLHSDAERPFATYRKDRMGNVSKEVRETVDPIAVQNIAKNRIAQLQAAGN